MNVVQLKYAIIEKLIRTEDEQLLEKVAELMRSELAPYPENDLKPMTVEELEERIRRSRKAVEEGKFRTTEDLKNHFRNK
jgi:hypothetical protein